MMLKKYLFGLLLCLNNLYAKNYSETFKYYPLKEYTTLVANQNSEGLPTYSIQQQIYSWTKEGELSVSENELTIHSSHIKDLQKIYVCLCCKPEEKCQQLKEYELYKKIEKIFPPKNFLIFCDNHRKNYYVEGGYKKFDEMNFGFQKNDDIKK